MALLGPVVSLDAVGGSYRIHGANNYEPQAPELDIDHLRETIRFPPSTSRQLLRAGDRARSCRVRSGSSRSPTSPTG